MAIDATNTKARTRVAEHPDNGAALTHLIATAHGYSTAVEVAAGIALAGLIVAITVLCPSPTTT